MPQAALNWHAIPAKASGAYSFITRDDGQRYWEHTKRPLYRFENDKKPGDQISDGKRST
ncbi:hypothetical protein KIH07_17180 [Hydrogenophaga taeniospiralis]|uniref:hypothetical protein n=1 Tax=Hydrogenophaga taeniospiralis TaxID=65656 RepID=UPI001CFBE0BB|nr:hypothetical protein [Hydrogenophaga taeniospiralis]MCB4365477.1 hypothetical protein [Hydrogenophaga taeniospiralis]